MTTQTFPSEARGPVKVRVQPDEYGRRTRVLITIGDTRVEPLTVKPFGPDEFISENEDTFSARLDGRDLGLELLRAALNTAWELGMRPDGFNDTRESMAAKDAHLQDMRNIAFGKINIEMPSRGR